MALRKDTRHGRPTGRLCSEALLHDLRSLSSGPKGPATGRRWYGTTSARSPSTFTTVVSSPMHPPPLESAVHWFLL
jgi:hypothetical protein